MAGIPTLETERLRLAPPCPDDLDDMAAMWGDPAVVANIGGRPFTREEVWHRLLRYIGHWSVAGYGSLVARERTGGRFVGDLGIMDSRRATTPSFEGTPEAGWALATHAQGRGLAAEALEALLGWADAQGIDRTVCMIDPDHARSLRVAARVGFRPWTEATYRDRPVLLLARPGVAARHGDPIAL